MKYLLSEQFRSYEFLSLFKHLSQRSEILCCSFSLLSGNLDSASLWWPWKWVKLWKFIDKKQKSNVTAAELFNIKITSQIEIFMKKNQGSIYWYKVIYWFLIKISGEAEGEGFEPPKGVNPCWFSRPVHSARLCHPSVN